jgi:cell wall-associated NlpC family hydrolase
LIDRTSTIDTLDTQVATQLRAFGAATDEAERAAETSAKSAADARTAADQVAAMHSELQAKQTVLHTQSANVRAHYDSLTREQQAALADPGPMPAGVSDIPSANPASTSVMAEQAAAPPPGDENLAVVQAAMTKIGSPYSWGATGPHAFDCSGLVNWAFKQIGKPVPRSSQALAKSGQQVALPDLQPGDIVTFYSDASHVGIYIGDGNMVHASTFGSPVKIAPISSAPIFNARRY